MGIFRRHDPKLVDIAFKKAIMMLELGQEMFCLITDSLIKDTEPEKAANIKRMDKEINQMHREINRQIFEHLSANPDDELFPCLVLINVVKDSERIGDYNKNISEVMEKMPEKLDLGQYEEQFTKTWQETSKMFKGTITAFRDEDEKLADKILTDYKHLSDECDGLIEEILTGEKRKLIERDLVGLVLLMRYFKRINAHLKNIASTVINPFHRIGYKQKKRK